MHQHGLQETINILIARTFQTFQLLEHTLHYAVVSNC